MEMSDKLKEPNNTLDETIKSYYTDIYSPGESKEQISIGEEVAERENFSGEIDTATFTEKKNNTYTLSIPNPDGVIFSLGITDRYGYKEKTFKVGYFGNTALAYSTLLTELQTWLGSDYEIAYISGTDYTISRIDGTAFTKSSPNLTRTITLTGFDTISIIDVIIDGTTITLNGATHSGSSSTAISYLANQLSSSIYYTSANGNVLTFARKDGAISTITKAQYNRYTYSVNYSYIDTPSSGQFPDYTDTTIDGTTYRFDYKTDSRAFYGDKIIRSLSGTNTLVEGGFGGHPGTISETAFAGTRIFLDTRAKITKITKQPNCTATRGVIKNTSGTILATANFVGNDATFDLWLDGQTSYDIGADSNGSSYTKSYTNSINNFGEITNWTDAIGVNNIYSIDLMPQINISGYSITDVRYNKSSGYDSVWNTSNTSQYYTRAHNLFINKTDYTTMSITSNTHYTVPGSFPDDSLGFSLSTTNHLADITTATPTEITITLTNTGFTYFVKTGCIPNKIVMTAYSSGGQSEGIFENRSQSCMTKYSSTTTLVADKIFKTDGNNYGNIVSVRRDGFTIIWTTNTSNKLTYTCYK